MLLQILSGLHHMHHEHRTLHRDVKALNVLFDARGDVKLADMGVARVLGTSTSLARTVVGTPFYLAPELCRNEPYTSKVDVWAVGVLAFQMCMRSFPFQVRPPPRHPPRQSCPMPALADDLRLRPPSQATNHAALVLAIMGSPIPPVVGYSPDLVAFVRRCLQRRPAQRPDVAGLLQLKAVR